MLSLGIERHHGLVYEGSGKYGRAVWPAPIVTPAKIVFESEGPLVAERSSDSVTSACRFREDVNIGLKTRQYVGAQTSHWRWM